MFIWDADFNEFIKLTIAVAIMFSFFLIMLYLVFFNPKLRDKILSALNSPFVYFGDDPGSIIMLLILVMFLMSSCMLCFVSYGWVKVLFF